MKRGNLCAEQCRIGDERLSGAPSVFTGDNLGYAAKAGTVTFRLRGIATDDAFSLQASIQNPAYPACFLKKRMNIIH